MASNTGSHSVDTISDTVKDRMALYDALPKRLRDVMKEQAFNYSPVSMKEWAKEHGVPWVRRHMIDFDRKHWRDFFVDEFGSPYPDKPKRARKRAD